METRGRILIDRNFKLWVRKNFKDRDMATRRILDILLDTKYKDEKIIILDSFTKKSINITLKRGDFYSPLSVLSEEWDCSKSSAFKFIQKLEKLEFISKKQINGSKEVYYHINNYDNYQSFETHSRETVRETVGETVRETVRETVSVYENQSVTKNRETVGETVRETDSETVSETIITNNKLINKLNNSESKDSQSDKRIDEKPKKSKSQKSKLVSDFSVDELITMIQNQVIELIPVELKDKIRNSLNSKYDSLKTQKSDEVVNRYSELLKSKGYHLVFTQKELFSELKKRFNELTVWDKKIESLIKMRWNQARSNKFIKKTSGLAWSVSELADWIVSDLQKEGYSFDSQENHYGEKQIKPFTLDEVLGLFNEFYLSDSIMNSIETQYQNLVDNNFKTTAGNRWDLVGFVSFIKKKMNESGITLEKKEVKEHREAVHRKMITFSPVKKN